MENLYKDGTRRVRNGTNEIKIIYRQIPKSVDLEPATSLKADIEAGLNLDMCL